MPLDYIKFTLVKSNLAYSSRANSVSSITTCFKQISTQSTKSLIIKLTVLYCTVYCLYLTEYLYKYYEMSIRSDLAYLSLTYKENSH